MVGNLPSKQAPECFRAATKENAETVKQIIPALKLDSNSLKNSWSLIKMNVYPVYT